MTLVKKVPEVWKPNFEPAYKIAVYYGGRGTGTLAQKFGPVWFTSKTSGKKFLHQHFRK